MMAPTNPISTNTAMRFPDQRSQNRFGTLLACHTQIAGFQRDAALPIIVSARFLRVRRLLQHLLLE